MNLAHLHTMFRPTSIALVGATEEEGTPGPVLLKNIRESQFIGPILPIHERLTELGGLPVFKNIDTLPTTPDLAILCSEPESLPQYIRALGQRGVAGAVVLGCGFSELLPEDKARIENDMLIASRETGMRLLGPGSMGFLTPRAGVNASLAHCDAQPGRIAFVTQSDALFTTILDWAQSNQLGFSNFISLGDKLDFGFGTVLDYLNADPETRAILLYVEDIKNARHFMSAARAASRSKPVIVLKAGRTEQARKELARIASGPIGLDAVYDAAFRRAGMLRVSDTEALFDSVETLARTKPLKGERLAILVNGLSPGLLTLDRFIEGGGKLAELSDETKAALSDLYGDAPMLNCRADGCVGNPITLSPNAPPERYAQAVKILLKAKGIDALLVMHFPSALADGREIAKAVAKAAKRTRRLVFCSWIGGANADQAQEIFNAAGLPIYATSDKAIRAYLNLIHYRRNQELLVQTPASLPSEFEPDLDAAQRVIATHGTGQLPLAAVLELLRAYRIPIIETRTASTPDEAASIAGELGFPVALKILSPDLACKSRVGGVILDLDSAEAVRAAAKSLPNRVLNEAPHCAIQGYIVQRMGRRPKARELALHVDYDPVFGPYISCGRARVLAPLFPSQSHSPAVALPPLNMALARELVTRAAVLPLDDARFDISALCLTLCKLSQLLLDLPTLQHIQIDPLCVDDHGVLALDASASLLADFDASDALAIRPYPRELEQLIQIRSGKTLLIRPITPEDEPAHWDFIAKLSAEDLRFRFFGLIQTLPRAEMIRLTQIDYDREMAFIAIDREASETLGVVRGSTSLDNQEMEFAIIIRSDIKRQGLGRILLQKLIDYAAARGCARIIGQTLIDNSAMAALATALGFTVSRNYDDGVFELSRDL